MDDISSQSVSLPVADGSSMGAFLARPTQDAKHPAVILFQEAFGVNHHIQDVAQRLAREGYVTVAPELFHRTAPGFVTPYDNFPAAAPHLKALTPETIKLDAQAAYDWLRAQAFVKPDQIASIGFCVGGRASFLACVALPLQASISFYGGGISPALLGEIPNLQAPILFFWGGLDKHIGQDQIRPIMDGCDAAGKPFVNVGISNADHGFFCNERPTFNAAAADLGWKLSQSFLELHIKTPERRARVR